MSDAARQALVERLSAADAERQQREARIADIPRWAERYYPDCAEIPPAISALRLTDAEIVALFSALTTRRQHLALVDQRAIRERLSKPELADAARAAWKREEWA